MNTRNYNYHFTPPKGWMNDPNGLVYVNGVYHLFYQHYPHDIVWGPMHWGHAVSTDLLHWEHKPIAIFPTETEYIFSGSCVYDAENVSGLGTKECPPLVVLYTGHNPVTAEEQQCIAYSTDFETFTKYEGNPVIANKKYLPEDLLQKETVKKENPLYQKDFRDPKIFINPVKGGFSMVLAAGQKLEFYHSANLLSWEKTGEFAPKNGFDEICECPDCFPLETEEGTKWILTLSLTSHVMPYFVGEFDGDTFVESVAEETVKADTAGNTEAIAQELGCTISCPLLLDYAADNYAMVSFLHSPEPLLLGWGESWDYISQTPAEQYRGKMTLARRVQLVKTAQGWRLKFAPVLDEKMPVKELSTEQCTADFNIWQGTIKCGGKAVFHLGEGKQLVLSVTEKEILVDRSAAGDLSFSEFLQTKAAKFSAKRVMSGSCNVTVVQENGYFEIFAEDGLVVFSVMTY